jgi:hypothetical protein
MVMSSNIFAQRYVDGRSLLRYLPLFSTMNDTLNPPGRLPKPLKTHGKRAAKKGGKIVTCLSCYQLLIGMDYFSGLNLGLGYSRVGTGPFKK